MKRGDYASEAAARGAGASLLYFKRTPRSVLRPAVGHWGANRKRTDFSRRFRTAFAI